MARRRGPPMKLFGSTELTDFSTDLGFYKPADLIAAIKLARQFVFDLETTGLSPKKDRIEGLAFHVPAVGDLKKPVRAWYPFNPFTFMCHLPVSTVQAKWDLWKQVGINLDQLSETIKGKEPHEIVLCDLRPPMDQEETMTGLRPVWEEIQEAISIAANRKFDDGFLYYASGTTEPIVMRGIIGDSMLADFCSDERRMKYGLKTRVKQEFGHDMTTYADAVRGAALLAFCDAKPLGVYAMDDCEWTWRLHEHALAQLRKQAPAKKSAEPTWTIEKALGRPMGKLERIYWGIDCKISSIIMEMENTGVLIDWRWLVQVEERLAKEKVEIAARIEKYLGWPLNPNSGKQVGDALFAPPPDGLGLPMAGIPIGKTGDPSTSDKVIKHFARFHPLVADILNWRSLDTVETGFVKKLIKLATESSDGRIYGHFNQTRTVIARLSSSDPINFQNQPRDKNLVRKAYCSYREGVDEPDMLLLGGDYGQIELRVAAHLANEANMIEVYQMGGICTAESGGPCLRYTFHECHACDACAPPNTSVPGKLLCSKCGSEDIAHQARCRHVDLHQRTAEDAQVKRNPLAKCLDGSTLLLAAQGADQMRPQTIESLVGDIEPGEHRPIAGNLFVDRGVGNSQWASATSALKRHNRPTKIVVTKRAVVVATNDHRFQVIGDYGSLDPATPGYAHVPGYSLVEAQHLEKGMKIPVAKMGEAALHGGDEWHRDRKPQVIRLNPFTKEIGDGPATITLDEDWAYFAGVFQGDGCASGNACVITHSSLHYDEEWRRIVRTACDRIGLPTALASDKRSTRLGSRVVRRYLEGLKLCKEVGSSGERTMRIPQWVLDGGPSVCWSYLAGLFDTDGTVGSKEAGTASITTKYPEFAGQIAFLLRHLGMPVLVQPSYNKTYERWYYTIHVIGEGLERFQRYCPIRHPEKRTRLVARNDTIKRRCAPTDDEVLLVLDGGERTVYDFQVETADHLYLQGGLVGHNNLNFGLLYRMGAPKFCVYADLFDADGMPMVDFAKDVIERWHGAYPNIAPFHEITEYYLEQNNWIAETIFGRRRRLDQEMRINRFRAVTQGIQFKVSGSAQDIMKAGMIRVIEERNKRLANARPAERALWKKFRILLQIHDELVCEVPTAIKAEASVLMKTAMESIAKGHLRVPLAFDVKTGRTWDDIH